MSLKTIAFILWGFTFLTPGCDTKTKSVNSCGDGFLDPGEDCDGSQMTVTTCLELGYYEQTDTLICKSDCTYDLSVCMGGRCGDGTLQREHEDCEGDDLDGQTCISLGYERGTLVCDVGCRFDRATCEGAGACGDGTIQEPEACDGNDLGGATCQSLGYYTGTLLCREDCQFEQGVCAHRCGDGVVDELYQEVCDGMNLNGLTCQTQGYGSGTLTCDDTCAIDTAGCSLNYESPNIGTLIHVPSGTFQRDATSTNLSQVSAFRMSQHEITRAQWTAVTGWPDPSYTTYSSGMNDPVQQVRWYDVIAFCNKLSLLEGLTPVYTVGGVNFSTLTYAEIPTTDDAAWNAATANWVANGYRLPTEMEWMWAAMGAETVVPGAVNTTGFAKAFAGSTGNNLIEDFAVFGYNTSESGRTMTPRSNPVGSKLANELGFHDLSGNVWEWVWDWYAASYPTGTQTDSRGPASGAMRVGRGGNWYDFASYCSVASRSGYNPYDRDGGIGFRVIRP